MLRLNSLYKTLLCATAMLLTTQSGVFAQSTSGDNMSRSIQAQATKERLFNDQTTTSQSADFSSTDPELAQIEDNLVFGELFYQGSLSDKQRILVLIASLTTTSSQDDLAQYIQAGLNLKIPPVALKEAIYQCAPYVGLSKVKAALKTANHIFAQNKISLPLPDQSQVTEENRFAKGKEAQTATFGEAIDAMHKAAAPDQRYLIVDHLSAYCFGDIFTRSGLSHAERELVIFAAIISLGGADGQAKAHAQGNLTMGNSKQNLFDTAALLMPYIGFPRTLNATAIVNQLP